MADTPAATAPTGPPPSTNIQHTQPAVSFQTGNVPPSQYVYLQQQDLIGFNLLTNTPGVVYNFIYRFLTPQGEVKEGNQPVRCGGTNQFTFLTLGEGWLLSWGLSNSAGFTLASWVYAQVYISRGFISQGSINAMGMIWQGYLPGNDFIGWPGTPAKRIDEGSGVLRSVTGTTPGAGADISETVPSNRRWSLVAFRPQLVSNANVANRNVTFVIDDGVNVFARLGTNFTQVAGQTIDYTMGPGMQRGDGLNDSVNAPCPQPLLLKSGFRIRTTTTGLQAGDQWSAPQYLVQEFAAWDI